MARTRCQICGEFIGRDDRIVRVFAEAVEKRADDPDDPDDPDKWTRVLDWPTTLTAHLACVWRDGGILVPCLAEHLHRLDYRTGPETERGPILTVVKP